ncbi:MAG: hypothetical protein VKJ46_06195 [Leptolyngbyaceae bacterium]|nr:hypothetical protein [Leptolyngbyaceae bacterium]
MQATTSSSLASRDNSQQPLWQTIATFTLVFWMGSSLLLDLVIMPSLYTAGMMTEPGFATAGYSIFWLFNRIELVCAATVLTGLLWVRTNRDLFSQRGYASVLLSAGLLAIAFLYTYGLTPQMSALGIQLNLFESVVEIPNTMNQLHISYWVLETVKLTLGGALLNLFQRNQV